MSVPGVGRFSAVVFAAILVLLLAGCKTSAPEEAEEDLLPKEPVPVRAVRAELTTLRPSVDLVGTLVALPECTTTVSPQVAGWVQKVLVVEELDDFLEEHAARWEAGFQGPQHFPEDVGGNRHENHARVF